MRERKGSAESGVSFKEKKWLYRVVGKGKKNALGFKGEKNVTLCLGRKVWWGREGRRGYRGHKLDD